MAVKSFEEILKDLKNRIYYPVYYLSGEEPYYIDQITDYIENKVLDDSEKEFNQTVLYGRECDALSLVSTVKRYPMMSNYQVVIVKEAQEMKALAGKAGADSDNEKADKNPLTNYFQNPLTSTILVICLKYKQADKRTKLYKAIDKCGIIFDSKKLYDNKIAAWIEQHLATKNYNINPQAAQLMADHIGNDLSRIANECDKLFINLKPGETITVQHIESNIGISKDFNIFELQEAITQRDVLKANRIVNYFRANPKSNPFVITLATFYSFFSKVLLYHSLPDKSQMNVAAALRINPFFARSYETAARQFSAERTTNIISSLREYDLRSKGVNNGGAGDGELLRELVYRMLH